MKRSYVVCSNSTIHLALLNLGKALWQLLQGRLKMFIIPLLSSVHLLCGSWEYDHVMLGVQFNLSLLTQSLNIPWWNLFLLKRCAHNVTQYGVKIYSPMMMSSPYHTLPKYEAFVLWWCFLMLEIDIDLFNLSVKDCLFIKSTTETPKNGPLQHLIVIGLTHGFVEARLLVLVGRPHHSPPLGSLFKTNLNWVLYPMPYPPLQPCCTLHQQSMHCGGGHCLPKLLKL